MVDSPTKTLSPSLRHPDYNQQSQSHFALCAVNNITTATVNTPLITEANKPETHQEVIHSPHSKQWESAAQSSQDYVNHASLSSLMAYLKGKRVWKVGLYSSNYFSSLSKFGVELELLLE